MTDSIQILTTNLSLNKIILEKEKSNE